MNENYIVINGKKIELTEEQLKQFVIEPKKKRKNPFERVAKGNVYYKITGYGNVDDFREDDDSTDQALYDGVNYFNDDSVAQQVALHQLLYRKLLKFSYDNGCEDTAKWDCENRHWCIRYDHCDKVFCVTWFDTFHYSGVYFSTMESAERAIEEVLKPFMKKHPEFVW